MTEPRIPRPEFVDNRQGNTLAEALRAHLRFLTASFNQPIHPARARAGRRDIYDEWQRGADPANLQPDIRPLFRAAAQHMRSRPAGAAHRKLAAQGVHARCR